MTTPPGQTATPAQASRPMTAEAALEHARGLLQAGRLAEAEEVCRRVLAVRPRNADALYLAGTVACQNGKHEEGARLLRQAVQVRPSHADAHDNLGNAYAELGRRDEAEAAFRQAIELDPDAAPAHSNLGGVLQQMGRLDEAEASYRKAVALAPRHPDLLGNLGNFLMHRGHTDEAFAIFERATAIRRRPGDPQPAAAQDVHWTSATKLRHDAEQLRYLVDRGLLTPDYERVAYDYEGALAALPASTDAAGTARLPEAFRDRLAPVYNRMLYRAEAPALPGGALNPKLDTAAIEADYRRNAPGITYVDDLLRPEALDSLRRFCLESTFWFTYGFANGYLGAQGEDGFSCPLLSQIIEELRLAVPGIMGDSRLCKIWAFKYDSQLQGIEVHADAAAVNVNFWITPDDANLDPEGGGLIVWDKEAPTDWDFERFNRGEDAIRGFLSDQGARPVNIPHRQNRAVLFHSDLFHETAPLNFREGYENRRINITMLYGERGGRE